MKVLLQCLPQTHNTQWSTSIWIKTNAQRCVRWSKMIWGSRWGLPQREFLTPQALRSRWSCRRSMLDPLQDTVCHSYTSVPPLTTRCRSLHRRASPLSPGMTTRLRCPLRVWYRCPSQTQRWLLCFPDPSRLDEWFHNSLNNHKKYAKAIIFKISVGV